MNEIMGYFAIVQSEVYPKGYKTLFKLSAYPTQLEAIRIASDDEIEAKSLRDWVVWLEKALLACLDDPKPFVEDGIVSPGEIINDIETVVHAMIEIGDKPHALHYG